MAAASCEEREAPVNKMRKLTLKHFKFAYFKSQLVLQRPVVLLQLLDSCTLALNNLLRNVAPALARTLQL